MYIPDKLYSQIVSVLPITCIDVILLHQNRCLLLLRDNEPAKDQYWFPGGRLKKGEHIKDAVVRKVFEEVGLNCTFEKIVTVEETYFEATPAMTQDVHTINICCAARIEHFSKPHLDRFHKSFKWIDSIEESLHEGVKNPLKAIGF